MTDNPRILIAIGTRPEIIKMAPVYFELKRRGAQPLLLHTGQHTEMAEVLYEFSGIVPDYNILLDRPLPEENRSYDPCELSTLNALLLQKISDVMAQIDNLSLVLVHGDTTSAFTSALAAFYKQCPVAHIESGLRTHNIYSPFPEEMNRNMIARLASFHFAPTELARQNLLKENIDASHIHVVGNTIVEAAQLGIQKFDEHIAASQNNPHDLTYKVASHLKDKKLIMVTVHRHENQSGNIGNIARAVRQILEENADFVVVWPIHPNPRVKSAVMAEFTNLSPDLAGRVYLTQPLNYPVLLWILKNSWLVLTDSGGIQEEAAALSSPVLVLRDTTERTEIIDSGLGLLIGTKKEDIMDQVKKLRHNPAQYNKMKAAKNPFGDGTTAARICSILTDALSHNLTRVAIVFLLTVLPGMMPANAQYLGDPRARVVLMPPPQKPQGAPVNVQVVTTQSSSVQQTTTTTTQQAAPAQYAPVIQQPAAPAASPAAVPQLSQAPAQSQPDKSAVAISAAIPANKQGYIEAGGEYFGISNGFGNWGGSYLRGEYRADEKNLWYGEGSYLHRFKDNGFFASIGNTHVFNPRWYTSVAVGGSSDGFFLPRYRIDATLNHKMFRQRRFLASFGLSTSEFRSENSDFGILLGAAYYFEAPWILQGGVRINISSPGDVGSTTQFLAITQGRTKDHFITLRYSFGSEAYQVIGPGRTLVDFNSQLASIEWRQWVGEEWGFNLLGEYSHNPNYERTGARLGFFRDF